MKTEEGNKLIAEFMGVETYLWQGQLKQKFPPKQEWNGEEYEDAMILYHKSWDWLMPVVEKLEKIYNVEIKANIVSIYPKECDWDEIYFGDTKLEAVWKGCVDIIKWYNKNKS